MNALAPTALISASIRAGDQGWRATVADRFAAYHDRRADRFDDVVKRMEEACAGQADGPQPYLDAIDSFRQLAAVDREMARMVLTCQRTREDEESWELTLRMDAGLDARKGA